MQCTWSSAVPCVSSSSAMARSWAAKNLQFLPVLWVLPDSASSSGSTHALISSCYVPWQSMSISLAISLAISWLRGSHTRRLDNESTRYIHGKLRLSTLFSKALLIEALVLITVCFKRRTPQGRMELHCLCIVSALSLHCLCIVPSSFWAETLCFFTFLWESCCSHVHFLMLVNCNLLSWCFLPTPFIRICLCNLFFITLSSLLLLPLAGCFLQVLLCWDHFVLQVSDLMRSKDRLESLPDKSNCNKIR